MKVLSSEKAREYGKKGGIASGKARQEKKHIRDALKKALSGKYKVGEIEGVSGYEALAISMIQQAISGNVQAFKEIRDTIGEKPTEHLKVEGNENQELLKEYLEGAKNGNFIKGQIKED